MPTCPICRGSIEINRRRMQGLVDGGLIDNWDEEERNFLQTMIKMAGTKFVIFTFNKKIKLFLLNLFGRCKILIFC